MVTARGSFGEIDLAIGVACPYLLPSASEMAALDKHTIEGGTAGSVLMERAGTSIAEQILGKYPALKRCVVLCGPGNNGGDGLVITRVLREHGVSVSCIVAFADRYSRDCLNQLAVTRDCLSFGGEILEGETKPALIDAQGVSELASRAEVIIDALLGTGQRSEPRGSIGELIRLAQALRSRNKGIRVVAVDIPTGLDADTGRVFDTHIVADTTCTVQFVKRGMVQFPGRGICGDIRVLPIGIMEERGVEFSLAIEGSVSRLPARSPNIHKGSLGRVLVLGGSLSMPGAPMLAALAALRSGAGIVSRVVRRGWTTIPALPEAMFEVLDGSGDSFNEQDIPAAVEMLKRYDVAVIGPGLGAARDTGEFLKGLLDATRNQATKVVLDADALNLIARYEMSLADVRGIVTPHPGEASRLLGVQSADVQADRFTAVRQLAQRLGVVAVLKGAGTLVHNGSTGRVVADGTPYLATPGSGDVLSGIIAACVARQESLFDAAVSGVWIHAKAGVSAASERGGPILASEIALHVGEFVQRLEGSHLLKS